MPGAAAVAFPRWSPHPDVWLIVGMLAAGYAIALTRLGPRQALRPPGGHPVPGGVLHARPRHGVGRLRLADPRHRRAVQLQHPHGAAPHVRDGRGAAPAPRHARVAPAVGAPPPAVLRTVRTLSRFVPALLLFNLVLIVTHWPWMVNESLNSAVVHFTLHAVLFVSSLIVWLPVVSPLPEIPRLQPVMRMLYLFAWSVVPTVPASFLTFGSVAALQVLRERAAPVRSLDARGPTARGPDHEDRRRTPTLVDHRRRVLPLGSRRGSGEHTTTRSRRSSIVSSRKWG